MAVLLLALALRLAPWGDNRFLEDEALYASWGLQIATGADPMLDDEPVDKPPLHPYTLALSFLLLARPDRGRPGSHRPLGISCPPAQPLCRRRLGGPGLRPGPAVCGATRWAGLLAALLLALSPFDILFASTAFTDPLMIALVLGALLAAARGRLGAAGLLAGLAAATKQQGLLFLPLVVAVGLLSRPSGREPAKPGRSQRRLARLWHWAAHSPWAAGCALPWPSPPWPGRPWVGCLARAAPRVLDAGPRQLRRPGAGPRREAGPSAPSTGCAWPAISGSRPGSTACSWRRGGLDTGGKPVTHCLARYPIVQPPAERRQRSKIRTSCWCFSSPSCAFHWLVAFQVWDRYLLGLVPLVALLAGRALVGLGQAIRPAAWRRVYAVGTGAGPVGLAGRAGRPRPPAASCRWAATTAPTTASTRLAAYLRANVPAGAVLYHHWLGYHYRFYLYGAPLRLHWYPDPADLVQDATVYRREPRYIAFPSLARQRADARRPGRRRHPPGTGLRDDAARRDDLVSPLPAGGAVTP